MKKPSVPATGGQATPAWVNAIGAIAEIICGRRANRLDLPDIQTLTISNPPTQAEMQALNAYVNEWAKALRNLVARFDD